jgi:hypothetical protein
MFIQVSSPSPKKLGDLARAQRVYAICEPCRRSEQLNVRALIARFGEKVPLAWFRRMLRCRTCGGSGAKLYVVDKKKK